MTDRNGPGQRSKAAAEDKTAEVARADAATQAEQAAAADEQHAGADQTPERADGAPDRREGVVPEVDPYPDYDASDADELQSHADSRGVEINRDVEKAELIRVLREHDAQDGPGPRQDTVTNLYASYDQMPLAELRALAGERDVELPAEFRKAHLVTELRAADSGTGPSPAGPAPVEKK